MHAPQCPGLARRDFAASTRRDFTLSWSRISRIQTACSPIHGQAVFYTFIDSGTPPVPAELCWAVESPKLAEFDLMDIDRNEQGFCYLSLFAVVGEYSALMSHHETIGDSVVGGIVESRSTAKNIYGIFVPPQ
jgi:hypothetical protein